ncbi:HAD family hydrolase [Actinoplanes friuliensis]|jgi:putative hydrolase of the HAD superfamily|uniref:Putative haloacid dehalogenase-like hydrolase n=1 Tax=Actinoplanes friuliensis DSM 7358 TaxID=1246995 RepID=U5W975_9ACTN|nr:HAD-IA family hydrolase [Actinoplanes friuliensis]AGZ45552.1 putative haloacid dehalogenase-like hydrolase [Actinoplanes friuliensis DSM 7358]
MHRQPAQALLIDLDGVLRRWDPAVPAAVEQKYGLEPGALLATAMNWELLRPAVAGEITDAEWMWLVASRLPLEEDVAKAAVAEWQQYRGEVDPEVLAFVREVRAAGRPVGLATNATELLRGDLDLLSLADEFDTIVSSWELKIHKPAPEFFERACAALGVEAPWVLFVDDDDRAVRGARAMKMPALRWSGAQDLPYLRKALDISA